MSGQPGEDKLYRQRISEHLSSGGHHARETDKHDHSAGHGHDAHAHHHEGQDEHVRTGDTLRDPVCGMTVLATPDTPHLEHHGETVYFCCDGCRTKYLAQVGP